MHAQETPISSWPSHQLSGGSRHRSIWSKVGKMLLCACMFGVVAVALGKSSLNCNVEAGM